MSHQFKPGDLAIIVSTGPRCEQNLGKVVEVVEVECPPLDDHPICVRGDGMVGQLAGFGAVRPAHTNWCRPRQLMPLRGDFAPEQQKAREAEPCA